MSAGAALPPRRETRRSWLLPLALMAAVAVIVALVLTSFKDATVYSKGVDQILVAQGKWVGRRVRVEGTLVKHTLKFQERPCEYRFDAERAGQVLHVRYPSCIKPDTLRDDMPEVGVTAEGTLLANGEFQASNVLAKCPSKYEMKDKAQKGYPGHDLPPASSAGAPGSPPAVLSL